MELNYEEFKIKKIFLNMLLKKGKKTNSENIFKNILINIKKTTKQKPKGNSHLKQYNYQFPNKKRKELKI